MKDYLDKPCYKKNYNEGQKNWKELLTGRTFDVPNILILCSLVAANVLFVVTHI